VLKPLIALFVGMILSAAAVAQSPYASDLSFRPTEGIWWSSMEPGTGVAFNMDRQGRWFAAIYLYNEDGSPTFLTMQGEALAYADPGPRPAEEPWAIAASPLILSEGGQCLRCPWTQATTSDTGLDAEIRFFGRNSASLRVGDWGLFLRPLTVTGSVPREFVIPEFTRAYIFKGAIEPGGLEHVAVVRLRDGGGFTGTRSGRFECIVCRTVDAEGNASDELDERLRERVERLYISCGPGFCLLTSNEGDPQEIFVDKSGTLFSVLDSSAAPDGEKPVVITFQLLDDEWRPGS
jgi:hypothetical protein